MGDDRLLGVTDKESLEVQWRIELCFVSLTEKVWKSSRERQSASCHRQRKSGSLVEEGSLLGVTDKESITLLLTLCTRLHQNVSVDKTYV